MDLHGQVKFAIGLGVTALCLLILDGLTLPFIISSQMPLIFIIFISLLLVIGFPVCGLLLYKLFFLKKIIKKSKPKGKHHGKSKTEKQFT